MPYCLLFIFFPLVTASSVDRSTFHSFAVSSKDIITGFASALGKRLIIGQAGRAWRGPDVRSFIAVNGSESEAQKLSQQHRIYNETYAFFPDEGTSFLGKRWHGQFASDSRAVILPLLAYKHFGETFKWMLYGDDDTVWFVPAVKKLLMNYDPEVPHAISDRSWHVMCLPCHFDPENPLKGDLTGEGPPAAPPLSPEKLSKEAKPHPRACPYCTPAIACGGQMPRNTTGKSGGSCGPGTIYGGSGLIMSVGLLRRLNYDFFLECIMRQFEVKGSDRMIGTCLFDSGFGLTDPGYMASHNFSDDYRIFMPSWPHMNYINKDIAIEPIIHGKCNDMCLWRARNQVSMHAKVRGHPGPDRAAAQVIAISRMYLAAVEYLDLIRDYEKEGLAGALSSWKRHRARKTLMNLEQDIVGLFGDEFLL